MLNIYYGEMDDVIFNTSVYFKNVYHDEWITSPLSVEMIAIDEGNHFMSSVEFAGFIQNTDNYYLLVTREGLSALPYSVEEIYGICSGGKYGGLTQTYHEFRNGKQSTLGCQPDIWKTWS